VLSERTLTGSHLTFILFTTVSFINLQRWNTSTAIGAIYRPAMFGCRESREERRLPEFSKHTDTRADRRVELTSYGLHFRKMMATDDEVWV